MLNQNAERALRYGRRLGFVNILQFLGIQELKQTIKI